jgi:hypothetical protein
MASPSSSSVAVNNPQQTSRSRRMMTIVLLLISALYFADTLLRASLKTFWYDELVTVYLCRLPSFGATWSAVLHGADLNPPLLYLLTRWSQHLFGEGLIATRLPEILSFWLFGLCLFWFAKSRLGPLRGAIAGFFPVFTLAHYYAYEARPHGIVLGCFGLMLLCWQRARAGNRALLWSLGLWISYIAALLAHVYAVYLLIPFLAVEAVSLARHRRIHLGITVALLLAPPCVAPLYLRLYSSFSQGKLPGIHIHLYELVQHYLIYVLGPALLLLVLLLVFLAWKPPSIDVASDPAELRSLHADELWLALALGALPVIGVAALKVTHAFYFDRYFLEATAGYALLLAQATVVRGSRALVARGMLFSMVALLSADTLIAAYCHMRHADIDQIEPSSHIAFVSNPAKPLARNAALLRDTTHLDILVTNEPDYLYLQYYAPPSIRKRLVFGSPPTSAFLKGYQSLTHWGRTDFRIASFDEFFAQHNDFLVYSSKNAGYVSPCMDCLEQIVEAGYTLRSVDPDADNLLEHFSK